MIVDAHYIQQLRESALLHIPKELEEILIDRLGKEPEPYEFSEQDCAEQTRKIINRFRTPKGRLELLHKVDILEAALESIQGKIWLEMNRFKEEENDF